MTHPQASEPAPSLEVLQALTDPENQPNQFGVVFGMRGPRMFFTIGNQSFDLSYEPDGTEEFEFMKRMLCSAFSTFTPDVKTVPAPSTAGEHSSAIEMAIAALKDLGSHGAYSASIAEPAIAALLQSAPVADDARTVWELTDEQIDVLVTAHGTGGWQSRTDMAQFARAIEAAHGIGGKQ